MVLVRRVEGGVHGGQIAFPGGTRLPQDNTILDTALREAHEEVGVPLESVTVLSPLPVVETRTTGFSVSPFLARIAPPLKWQPEPSEIAEVIETHPNDLVRPEAHGQETRELPGHSGPVVVHFYRVGPHKLWGVTYRIVNPLIPRLLSGEWTI